MTNGIIQKVIHNLISDNFFFLDNGNQVVSVRAIKHAQRELIEEIKKERGLIWDANTPKSKYIQFLIGDNE